MRAANDAFGHPTVRRLLLSAAVVAARRDSAPSAEVVAGRLLGTRSLPDALAEAYRALDEARRVLTYLEHVQAEESGR